MLPSGSMYGIFTYIWLIFMVNVGIYIIHGSYGLSHSLITVHVFNTFHDKQRKILSFCPICLTTSNLIFFPNGCWAAKPPPGIQERPRGCGVIEVAGMYIKTCSPCFVVVRVKSQTPSPPNRTMRNPNNIYVIYIYKYVFVVLLLYSKIAR